jgi:hypothetical protein
MSVSVANYEYVKKPLGRPKLSEDKKKKPKNKISVNPVGRPKKEVSEATFDKKAYMKQYMKEYNQKNKEGQHHRRNTSYYINRYNIDSDFVDKYGIYTACIYKTIEDLKLIHKDCPLFLKDIKDYIEKLENENI